LRRGAPSLNRPHPSHSWAHRDFAARRLVRDAFAVRERLGDPRVVPSFHRTSFLTCRPFQPRGVRHRYYPELRRRVGLRRMAAGSALPSSRNPFHGGGRFGGFTGSLSLQPAELLAPVRIRLGYLPQPPGTLLSGFQRIGLPPVALYNYNSERTPLLAGLSPAGMAASFAAR
jgi:hypothetical protein